MKNITKLLLVVLLTVSFNSFTQETLLNDYSVNEMGKNDDSNEYEELYLSTYTEQSKGKAYDGILIKTNKGYASSVRPLVKIPIELIPEFQMFLKNGREKYYEWKKTAIDNNITDMEKTISVFPHKLTFGGDDYGYFSGKTDVKLNFNLKDGYSKMIFSAYLSNDVRTDSFYLSLVASDGEWRDLGLLRLINDMTTEKVQTEIDKINNSADLFKN